MVVKIYVSRYLNYAGGLGPNYNTYTYKFASKTLPKDFTNSMFDSFLNHRFPSFLHRRRSENPHALANLTEFFHRDPSRT